MTRDEANSKAQKAWVEGTSKDAGPSMVNVFVALGMLKLDEPKSVSDKFIDVLEAHVEHKHIGDILHALDRANLKIVEK